MPESEAKIRHLIKEDGEMTTKLVRTCSTSYVMRES